MHLDPEQVQRTLHGELGSAQPTVRDHLKECEECRLRVSEAEREEAWILGRLGQLDHPAPVVEMQPITRTTAPRHGDWHRLAAGVVLVVGLAGAAYAAPGSPLPSAVHHLMALFKRSGRPSSPLRPAAHEPTSQAGVAVTPGDRFIIDFPAKPLGVIARVALTDGREVVVRAHDGATFTSETDRLLVQPGTAGGRFDVEIPRWAPRVEIRAGNRLVFAKESSRIVTRVVADPDGTYPLLLEGDAK